MNPKTKAYLELHISVFLFGFTAILGRLIDLHGITIVWYRLAITILSLLLFPGILKAIKKIPRKTLLKIFGIGIIVSSHWVFFYAAIKYSNVSVTLSALASASLFTAIIEPLVFKRRVRISELFLGAMVILGFVFIFQFGGNYLTGIILAIISAILAALFGTLNKTVVEKADAKVITLLEFVSGLLFLSLIMPIYLQFFPDSNLIPTLEDLGYLVILALLCTTLAFVLTLNALRQLTAFTVSLAINLEPIYGIILAYFFFREDKELNSGFYIGAAIILLAVFLHPVFQRIFEKK